MKRPIARCAGAVILQLACAALLIFGSGCSTLEQWDKEIKPPKKQAAVLIALSEDGSIAAYDGQGQPFRRCKVCNDRACGNIKDGDKEAIKRLQDAGYCTSLVKATTLAPFFNISVQKTRVNPYCWVVLMGGYQYEMCLCAAGEVDPRCIGTLPPPPTPTPAPAPTPTQ